MALFSSALSFSAAETGAGGGGGFRFFLRARGILPANTGCGYSPQVCPNICFFARHGARFLCCVQFLYFRVRNCTFFWHLLVQSCSERSSKIKAASNSHDAARQSTPYVPRGPWVWSSLRGARPAPTASTTHSALTLGPLPIRNKQNEHLRLTVFAQHAG